MKAAQQKAEVMFTARINGMKVNHGTINYTEYFINEGLVTYWDTRGFEFIDINKAEEVLMFVTGLGCKDYVTRLLIVMFELIVRPNLTPAEEEMKRKYARQYINNRATIDGVIICIDASTFYLEQEIKEAANMLRILKENSTHV